MCTKLSRSLPFPPFCVFIAFAGQKRPKTDANLHPSSLVRHFIYKNQILLLEKGVFEPKNRKSQRKKGENNTPEFWKHDIIVNFIKLLKLFI
jgi:hypothetical protein